MKPLHELSQKHVLPLLDLVEVYAISYFIATYDN